MKYISYDKPIINRIMDVTDIFRLVRSTDLRLIRDRLDDHMNMSSFLVLYTKSYKIHCELVDIIMRDAARIGETEATQYIDTLNIIEDVKRRLFEFLYYRVAGGQSFGSDHPDAVCAYRYIESIIAESNHSPAAYDFDIYHPMNHSHSYADIFAYCFAGDPETADAINKSVQRQCDIVTGTI